MVLAAGLGTRLRPLSDVCAKPLVPVGDRPALAHVLDRLRAGGVSRVVVNAHHRAGDVRAFAAAEPGLVSVSEERDLLGTAGGLSYARALLGEGDVLVWNADILATVDPRALVAEHGREGAEATLVVQPLAPGTGSVGLDASGRIVRLRQARFGEEASGGEFLGIHVLGAALRERLPERGGLVEDVFVPALARGATIRAMRYAERWHDIGTIAAYLAANRAWLEARGLASWVGPGARLGEGVTLDACVVGAGATVGGEGVLAGCVVWPGSYATAPLQGAVVTPNGPVLTS
jgi:mannose-1-phosphate guanylyltransferase